MLENVISALFWTEYRPIFDETVNLRQAVEKCILTLKNNEIYISNLKTHASSLECDFSQVTAALV